MGGGGVNRQKMEKRKGRGERGRNEDGTGRKSDEQEQRGIRDSEDRGRKYNRDCTIFLPSLSNCKKIGIAVSRKLG